jgi:hypothetical protein
MYEQQHACSAHACAKRMGAARYTQRINAIENATQFSFAAMILTYYELL